MKINSFLSFSTVDGPGVRFVVFMQGCPLKCIYCHNPETRPKNKGGDFSKEEVFDKILRHKPYLKNGGVTFSGGEPLCQADELLPLFKLLKEEGFHIALDTSGCILNESVKELLNYTDLVLLDIKMTSNEKYEKFIGTSLDNVLQFLYYLIEQKKETIIRHVVVPGITEKNDILKLKELNKEGFKIELLKFKKFCMEKYKKLGIPFMLSETPEASDDEIERFYKLLGEKDA